ncbi:hypothetical protein HanPSC8_Chr08g0323521 [Helianthus annuus]|nr:hypothetical protein HanLR1_Chr08g0275641 [Helianthus annuus]KAJ0901276.1 hypothetical protein HanPSC8_Chr08g0323521 [Helianthus annuus]
MIENFGDEFLFGADDVSTQHDVDGSEELDEMFSQHEVLVEQPQAPTLSKLEQDIKTALWNIKNLRPQSMNSLAARLTKHYEGDMSIEINWPHGMYPETEFIPRVEYVEYEGMLQFLANGLLDANFIHWCQMFLYGHRLKTPTQVAYFSTQRITGKKCEENLPSVKEHLVEVYKLHERKNIFLLNFSISNI